MTSPNDVPRCARGPRCPDTETAIDTTGAPIVVPAAVTDSPLCPTCTRHLHWALQALPVDIADLTVAMNTPHLEIRYREPDMPTQPRVKKGSPAAFDIHIEALRALIDHETGTWADHLADHLHLTWSQHVARAQRVGARVQYACRFLDTHLPELLRLPAHTYRCQSTGERPEDGHDPDTVTVKAGHVWIERSGLDAALLLLRLHEQVEHVVGRAPSDRLPIPCPACHRTTLFREHGVPNVVTATLRPGREGRVVCRSCWHQMSDDAYARLQDVTSLVFGVNAA